MNMLIAVRVAALAAGLSLIGAQALAADQPDRHGRGDDSATTQQQNSNDQGDQHGQKQHKTRTTGHQNPTANQNNGGQQGAQQDRNTRDRNNYRRRRTDQANDRNLNRHSNIDLARWHRNFDAPRRYRVEPYHAPRGYYYRRWGYGQRLPAAYYVRSFWLMDFLTYGLLSPPEGYVWVRFGPDALLIDEETGEIVQVQYNVFY
jgi:Ni/Co efflux regulator RcnB